MSVPKSLTVSVHGESQAFLNLWQQDVQLQLLYAQHVLGVNKWS